MKILKGTFIIVVVLIGLFLIVENGSQENVERLDTFQEPEKNPGWVEQWKMLKLEQGQEMDPAWTSKMRKVINQKSYARSASNLANVVEMGPSNIAGRTRTLKIDYTNTDRFLTASVSGGLWESLDKGETWTSLTDDEDNLSITWIEQDPFNSDVWYYSTGEVTGNSAGVSGVGIFKSTDNARTFQLLPGSEQNDFFSTWRIVCSRTEPNTLFVATSGGLWISEDGGDSFDKKLFRHTSDIEVFEDGSLLVGLRELGVYYSAGKSTDYAFEDLDLPFNTSTYQQPGRVEIDYCDSMPNTFYAAVENTRTDSMGITVRGVLDIFRTNDNGETWETTTRFDSTFLLDIVNRNGDSITLGNQQAWYDLAIQVHPTNPELIVFGTNSAAYSFNGGKKWRAFDHHTIGNSVPLENRGHADRHLFLIPESEPNTLYVASDGGIHEYTLNEETRFYNFKRNVNQGYNVTQFYAGAFFPDEDIVIGGTQDNGTLASNTFNDEMDRIRGGDGAYCAINQEDSRTVYQSFQNGSVWRSTDYTNPNSWSYRMSDFNTDPNNNDAIDEGVYFINPFEMNPHDNDELVFFTRQRPWLTIDGAGSWFPLTNNIPGAFCIAFDVNREGKKAAFIGGIARNSRTPFYRIDDLDYQYPGTEVDLRSSLPVSIRQGVLREMVMHPEYDSVLYAVFSTLSGFSRVWKVSNLYSDVPDWTSISGDLPRNLPVNDIEIHEDDPNVLIIGTDYGVFTTNNGGDNWVLVDEIPAVSVHQIRYRNTDDKLFVFTHGRGAFMGDLLPETFTSTENPTYDLSVDIFPNPTSSYLNYTITEDQELERVEVYNINGQLQYKRNITVPSKLGKIDISHLNSGNYIFVQHFENGQAARAKFVITD